jgi:membrane-associated phospholipid phosphatase
MCTALLLTLCLLPAAGDAPVTEPPVAEQSEKEEEANDTAEDDDAPPESPKLGQRFRNGARNTTSDFVYLMTFPKRVTRNGVRGTSIVGGGVVFLVMFDDRIQEQVQSNTTERRRSIADDVATLGDAQTVYVSALATWGIGKAIRHEGTAETGRALIESLVFAELLGKVAKGLFGRERPSSGEALDFFEDGSAFPSGHTWRVFVVATVLAERHGKVAAWIGYPIATLVGLARIEQNVHWASDVLAGAALGHVVAKAVVRRREGRASARQGRVRFSPMFDTERATYGVALTIRLGRN